MIDVGDGRDHHEQVVAEHLQLGPGVPVDRVLDRQRVQVELRRPAPRRSSSLGSFRPSQTNPSPCTGQPGGRASRFSTGWRTPSTYQAQATTELGAVSARDRAPGFVWRASARCVGIALAAPRARQMTTLRDVVMAASLRRSRRSPSRCRPGVHDARPSTPRRRGWSGAARPTGSRCRSSVIKMSSSIRTPMPRSSLRHELVVGLEVQPGLDGDHHARLQRALAVVLPPRLGAVVDVDAEMVRRPVHHPAAVLAAFLGQRLLGADRAAAPSRPAAGEDGDRRLVDVGERRPGLGGGDAGLLGFQHGLVHLPLRRR